MNRAFGNSRIVALIRVASILIGGVAEADIAPGAASAQAVAARGITVHITNHAAVDQKVLDRAGEILTHILEKVGVQATVLDGNSEMAGRQASKLSNVYIDVLPRERAERLRVSANVMGLAPGAATDHDRIKVFVFDHMVEKLVWDQVKAGVAGRASRVPHKTQILGYAMAHEIGHLLLHVASHSERGIMQASWDRAAMQDLAVETLTFSREEAERIQAEVARRTSRSSE